MKILTSFNGRPAPGGEFNPSTKIYTKAVRSSNGGKHPFRDGLGAIDDSVLERIKVMGCEFICLSLPDGEFFISFPVFLESGFKVAWKDPRFPCPRWYCPSCHWERTLQEAGAHVSPVPESSANRQVFMFSPADNEIRGIAQ